MRAPPSRVGHLRVVATEPATGERIEVADRAYLARGFRDTARGLLGITEFPSADLDALALVPCPQVHTRGMAFPIDVVMLSRAGGVRAVFREVGPGRGLPFVWLATWAVELPAGALPKAVARGWRLQLAL